MLFSTTASMTSRIILYASSRPDGNTTVIANYLAEVLQAPMLDLSTRPVAPFSYDNDYPEDDAYISTVEEIIPYDEWIFITPVYWYTMSAQMKTFFDRFSDILRYRKDLRPLVAGKGLWAFSCGSDNEPVPHFFTPFRLSAEYLGMTYKGDLHTWVGRVPAMKPEVKMLVDKFMREKEMF